MKLGDKTKPYKIQIIETPFLKFALKVDSASGEIDDLIVMKTKETTLLNRIFAAKVIQIVDSMDGIFLDIGTKDNAFMQRREVLKSLGMPYGKNKDKSLTQIVKKNQLLLAQVEREPFQGKGARLKAEISIVGKYFVLLPLNHEIKVSKKIDRSKLSQALVDDIALKASGLGLIIRSQVMESLSEESILEDLDRLLIKWQNIRQTFKLTSNLKCLYEADVFEDDVYRKLFSEDTCLVEVTHEDQKQSLIDQGIRPSSIKLIKWDYSEVKKAINKVSTLIESKVFTVEGARFTLDELEAFTIIDVDSGKQTASTSKESFAFDFNKAISKSIAKVLVNRNISGAILIDFINMNGKDQKEFMDYVQAHVFMSDDDFRVLGFTNLGLLELSRKRTHASLRASVSTMHTISDTHSESDLLFLTLSKLDVEILRFVQHTTKGDLVLQVNEPIYIFLKQNGLDEKRYGLKIKVNKDKRIFEPFNFQ